MDQPHHVKGVGLTHPSDMQMGVTFLSGGEGDHLTPTSTLSSVPRFNPLANHHRM